MKRWARIISNSGSLSLPLELESLHHGCELEYKFEKIPDIVLAMKPHTIFIKGVPDLFQIEVRENGVYLIPANYFPST